MKTGKRRAEKTKSAKEIAYLALFSALVIGGQYALSAIPGVEIVTVLFVSYSFCMGKSRGMCAATTFSLLRQIVFGIFPTVLILYLVYFNFLAFLFGWLGNVSRKTGRTRLWLVTLLACLCTAFFTLLDWGISSIWFGYTWKAAKAYLLGSVSFALPQILCSLLTVGYLFLPLCKVFQTARKNLGL